MWQPWVGIVASRTKIFDRENFCKIFEVGGDEVDFGLGFGDTVAKTLPPLLARGPPRFGFGFAEPKKESLRPSPSGAKRCSPKTTSQQAVWSVGVVHLNSLERDMEVIELDVEYVDDSAYPTTA